MKHRIILILFVAAAGMFTLTSNKSGVSGNSTAGCSCHSPTANTSTTVSMTGLTGSYAPDYTYTCTLTVSNSSMLAAGCDLRASAGTLTAGSTTRIINGDITHNTPLGMTNGSSEFVFTWKAPASGTGDVTFNFVGNAVNGDNIAGSPDAWNVGSLTLTESPTSISDVRKSKLKIYPNPALDHITIASEKDVHNVVVTNTVGQSMEITSRKVSDGYYVDLSSLQPGVYFLQYELDGVKYAQSLQVR